MRQVARQILRHKQDGDVKEYHLFFVPRLTRLCEEVLALDVRGDVASKPGVGAGDGAGDGAWRISGSRLGTTEAEAHSGRGGEMVESYVLLGGPWVGRKLLAKPTNSRARSRRV